MSAIPRLKENLAISSLRIESTLSDLPRESFVVAPTVLARQVGEVFQEDPERSGVLILDQERFVGMISRRRFFEHIGRQFGYDVFMGRPIRVMLESESHPPLILDETVPIGEAARQALSRPREQIYEPVVIQSIGNPANPPYSLLDIRVLLQALSRLQILQNEALEQNRKSILRAHVALEEANRNLVESIRYAEHIQSAMFLDRQELCRRFPASLLLHRPKDLVGGDCWWLEERGETIFLAVIDCTGHGVPGAFMTLIVLSLLARTLQEKGLEHPGEILAAMNVALHECLRYKRSLVDDGMDAGFCSIHRGSREVRFAGGGIPLIVTRPGIRPETIRGSRAGAGYARTSATQRYLEHTLVCEPGTRCYLATDGVTDLVGGPQKLTFGRRRLLELLASLASLSLEDQETEIRKTLEAWRGDEPPRDDMLLLGFSLDP